MDDVVQTQGGVVQSTFSGNRWVRIRRLQRVQVVKERDQIVHPQMQQHDVEGVTRPLAKQVILPLNHGLHHIRANAQMRGIDPLGGRLIVVVEVTHGALDQLVVAQAVGHQCLVEHRLVRVVHLYQESSAGTGGCVVHQRVVGSIEPCADVRHRLCLRIIGRSQRGGEVHTVQLGRELLRRHLSIGQQRRQPVRDMHHAGKHATVADVGCQALVVPVFPLCVTFSNLAFLGNTVTICGGLSTLRSVLVNFVAFGLRVGRGGGRRSNRAEILLILRVIHNKRRHTHASLEGGALVTAEWGVHTTKVYGTSIVGGHHEESVLTQVLLHALREVFQPFVQAHDHAAVVATAASRQVRAARDVAGQWLQGGVRRSVRHVQEQRRLLIFGNFGIALRMLLDVLVRSSSNSNSGVFRLCVMLVSVRVRSGLTHTMVANDLGVCRVVVALFGHPIKSQRRFPG
mmetsp:Transcript_41530/g.72028  ORF Transcript_41530/g.72028 Transcript_41530/m.72028 type:complete len:456 (+) Transcript_41530:1348-2715(+)